MTSGRSSSARETTTSSSCSSAAAALYTPKMLDVLREDFHRLPALLALDPPEQPDLAAEEEPVPAVPEPEPVSQLGLF